MSNSTTLRVPSYRRHKPTNQAVVTLGGKDYYLGKWCSAASKAAYRRLVAEWMATGGYRVKTERGSSDLAVVELAARYWKYAKGYYVKNGQPTSALECIRQSLRPLKLLYGTTQAKDFGPVALKAVRQVMLDSGRLNRTTINKRIDTIRRIFRWGVAEEIVPPTVYQGLQAVPGLRKGRTEAREPRVVLPVADEVVDATLPNLQPVVADMVRFQRLTGTRPAEICIMRPRDIDISGEVWSYRPHSHKTEHHGRERVIFIGPKAQDVLRPYLLREKTTCCFVPAESEQKRNAEKRANRKTPMTPSQAKRRPKCRPKRSPGNQYTTASYRRAITRAVNKENRERQQKAEAEGYEAVLLPNWHPNQLRHSAATEIRRQFGLEGAQVALGHSQANVTQLYAERDQGLAKEIMRKIG